MIIDAHTHYTTAPLQLQAYRGRQITDLARPRRARLQISDEELERSMRGQFQRMKECGIDRLLFSPQASAMGHHFGSPLVSRYWTEACNDLIARVARLWPDRISPVCQLPQSPGVSPKEWVDELERCVKELGFVGCNVNPDVGGGREPLTPSLGSEWWYPLWEKMVELDVPCTIHASASLNPAMHLTNAYYIAQHNAAAVEILKSRVLNDFPKLKIVIPHGGGAIPYQWNRQRGLHVREGLEPFEEVARKVYWDMAVYDKESMELLIKRVGVDNVLFATEMFGAVNAIDPKTGRNFEDLVPIFDSIDWLTAEDKRKITEINARKVFSRIPPAAKP
ncbi:MAG TPA: amidohydrolase family protein [candidate division Zixibacteria bacterium]|nr:amidohydrolase family protein [candidate division Zixibacteria bacterium]